MSVERSKFEPIEDDTMSNSESFMQVSVSMTIQVADSELNSISPDLVISVIRSTFEPIEDDSMSNSESLIQVSVVMTIQVTGSFISSQLPCLQRPKWSRQIVLQRKLFSTTKSQPLMQIRIALHIQRFKSTTRITLMVNSMLRTFLAPNPEIRSRPAEPPDYEGASSQILLQSIPNHSRRKFFNACSLFRFINVNLNFSL